jgi:hypothetical protein
VFALPLKNPFFSKFPKAKDLSLTQSIVLMALGILAPNILAFILFPYIHIIFLGLCLVAPFYFIWLGVCKYYEKKDLARTEAETK